MATDLTFSRIVRETVVVLRDGKPVGTIKRYSAHNGCIAHVPGILDASAPRGSRFFPTFAEAKAAILAADAASRPFAEAA